MQEARRDDERERHEPAAAVPAIVEAQVEEARARVFRAYVRARDKGRAIAFDDDRDARDEHRRAS